MTIEVENKVMIYEKNGERVNNFSEVLTVKSTHIWDDRVTLVFGDVRITVVARDLQAAIHNACNTGKY